MTVMTILETLSKAADLIEPPGAWTQGAFARNEKGYKVSPDNPEAICFCLIGSIRKISGNKYSSAERFVQLKFEGHRFDFNDEIDRIQPEVVAKLRSLAAQAAAEGV